MKNLDTNYRLFALRLLGVVLLMVGASALMAGEKAGKGFLGVNIADLTEKDQQKLKADFGVLVINVIEGTVAEKAGIEKHDVIQFFNGEKILEPIDLTKAVQAVEAGKKAKVKLLRQGKAKIIPVTLGKLKEKKKEFSWFDSKGNKFFDTDSFKKFAPRAGRDFYFSSGKSGGYMGIQMQDLNKDLGEYFGIKDGQGVLIVKVVKDSPAEKAGLKAGDVILELDGKKMTGSSKVSKVVSAYEKGDKVDLKIVRHKKKKVLKVELGEKTGTSQFNFKGLKGLQKLEHLKHLEHIRVPNVKMFIDEDGEHKIIMHDEELKEKMKQKQKIEEAKKKAKKKKTKTKKEHI